MADDAAHVHAKRCIEYLGLEVEPVAPVDGEKRADYVARRGQDAYVIEVKGPGENPAVRAELLATGHVTTVEAAGRTNSTLGKIRDAVDQLNATPAPDGAFRIAALVADSRDEDLQTAQYVSTLYGKEMLFVLGASGLQGPFDCYYFTFNEFHRHRTLDASLILTQDGSRLCPNTFAAGYDRFRSSHLYLLHRQHSALEDPSEAEAAGTGFILDADIDRRDETALLDFVRQKYSLPAMPFVIRPRQITGRVLVPDA